MHILSALFFAISSSGDSFIVGLSYGIKKVRINLLNNILVATISGAGTLFSMLVGKFILDFIPLFYANIIGSSSLILFGVYMIFNAFKNNTNKEQAISSVSITSSSHLNTYENFLKNPDLLDTNHSKNIEPNEALSLGLVLCINNIGIGLGASIAGLDIFLTSALSIIASMIFVPLGCAIGKRLTSDIMSSYSELFAAFLLILLGIYELFL